jgi:hypothetical protein
VQENESKTWEVWKSDLEEAWKEIPKPFRSERSIHRTLQCHLYGRMSEAGFRVVGDYLPPRIQDRPVDLIALNSDGEIIYAICFDRLVSLAAVKSLDSFPAVHKVVFTTGALKKKVQESRFFLKPDIHHVHLQPFEKSE